MNSPASAHARSAWARFLTFAGYLAMLVGAVDPMEGSLLILPGSGLVALGTWLRRSERRLVVHRILIFGLIAIGVSALWGMSSMGGIGGKSGYSMWWGLLILPYLIGWSLGIWAPGSPRWVLLLGIAVSLWYLTLASMIGIHSHARQSDPTVLIILVSLSLLTIGGCLYRLKKPTAKQA